MTVTPAEAARDLRKHASAIKSALWGHAPSLPAADLDEVDLQGGRIKNLSGAWVPLPAIYAVPHVRQRYTGTGLTVGGPVLAEFSVTLRYVATTVGEVQWADFQATRALEGRCLTLATAAGDQITSPLQYEGVADLPEQEDGGELYIAAKEWNYTL